MRFNEINLFGLYVAPITLITTSENVVVVHREGGQAGIAVEKLVGECQAIIKPLHGIFRDVPGVSGSTILDSGRVALILDVGSLLRDVVAEQAQAVN